MEGTVHKFCYSACIGPLDSSSPFLNTPNTAPQFLKNRVDEPCIVYHVLTKSMGIATGDDDDDPWRQRWRVMTDAPGG